MKFKLFIFALFALELLSCKQEVFYNPNLESNANIDSLSLELVWEKPLDSTFQKIKIFPYVVGENIIHTYDFGLDQILVYRNGKTGDEIKKIVFHDLIYPPNATVYNDKLLYCSIKSMVLLDPQTEVFNYLYVSPEMRFLNDRFKLFNDIVVTNENTFQAGDSLNRIIATNINTRKGKVLYANKMNTSRNYFFGNPQIWIDEIGDTILTVGREIINSASSPANLVSYNISKNTILFDMTFAYNTVNLYDNFICYKNKIYLKKDVLGVVCLDGKTGNSIWSQTIYDARSGGQDMFLMGERLIVISPSPDKKVVSFDIETGAVQWTNNKVPFFKDNTNLILVNNIIYFGNGDFIYGIDVKTGVLLKKQRITKGQNHLISNISYSEKNKLFYAIDSNFIKALRMK